MADVEEEELELAAAEGGGKSKTKLIIIIASAVVLLIAGTVGALFLAGVFSPAEETVGAEQGAQEAGADAPAKKAIYVSLEPAFTINLQPGGKARYLQVSLQVLTRDPETETQIKAHMPVIRNNLLLVMGSKSYEDLASQEGKMGLQREVRDAIGKILKTETGEDNVESVLFTTFVMQ